MPHPKGCPSPRPFGRTPGVGRTSLCVPFGMRIGLRTLPLGLETQTGNPPLVNHMHFPKHAWVIQLQAVTDGKGSVCFYRIVGGVYPGTVGIAMSCYMDLQFISWIKPVST